MSQVCGKYNCSSGQQQDNNFYPGFAHSWGKPKNKLTFLSERRKVRAKAWVSFPVRPPCSPLENRRQRMKELKATGWVARFKSGLYRGMPNGVVLRDFPKKVEPPIQVKSVSRNMREFLPRTQEHHRIDATTSILHRKTGAPTFVALRPSECEELYRK